MEITFNKDNVPLLAVGSVAMIVTKGGPTIPTDTPAENISPLNYGDKKVVAWGNMNNYPVIAEGYIRKSTVLNSGLKYKWMSTIAQGIYAATQTGVDAEGNDIIVSLNNPAIQRNLRERKVFNYMLDSFRDTFKYGLCFPEIIFSADGMKIDGINIINARFCRLTQDKQFVAFTEKWEGMYGTEKVNGYGCRNRSGNGNGNACCNGNGRKFSNRNGFVGVAV